MDLTKREISNIKLAMTLAREAGKLSKAVRSKVGAVIISNEEGFYVGVNGTLPNECNICEYETDGGLVTKNNVIHAEENALDKMHREGVVAKGCISVQSLSPCEKCFTRMRNIGIRFIVYDEAYRDITHLIGHEHMVMSYEEFCKKVN